MATGWWRNAVAALGVLGGLAVLIAAPAVISSRLPDEQVVPAGRRLAVGDGVTVLPPPGARLGVGPSRPGSGDIELHVAAAVMTLHTAEVRGSRRGYTAHARHKLSRDDGLLLGAAGAATTSDGVPGEQGALRGGGADGRGCYAIFSARTAGVVIVVTGVPTAGCEQLPEPIRRALVSVQFSAGGAL